MPYFLSAENLKLDSVVNLTGEEARHVLLSHRVKVGEEIKLQGPDTKRFLCRVEKIDKKSLSAMVIAEIKTPAEPLVNIVLFQSVVSEKALDFIFQKGTELGLSRIVLFNSANTATKISRDLFEKKQERWQKILIESAKQSERVKWPELSFVLDVKQIQESTESLDKVYLADIEGDKLKEPDSKIKSVAVLVGPEGGFTELEIKYFKSFKNIQAISLGPILLRAETAVLSSIATIQNIF